MSLVAALLTSLTVLLVLVAPDPFVPIAALAGVVLLIVSALRPALATQIALVLAVTALPAFVPGEFMVGGQTVRAYEPFLWIAAIAAVIGSRRYGGLLKVRPGIVWVALAAFGLAIAISILYGIGRGNPVSQAFADHRLAVNLFAGFLVTADLVARRDLRRFATTLLVTLYVSALFLLAASLTGLPLNGRSEVAQLYSVAGGAIGSGAAATRLLSPATFPALVALCVVLAMLIFGMVGWRTFALYAGPAVVVVFLGFSRNNLLAIAVTVLAACVIALFSRRAGRAVSRLLLLAASVTLAVLLLGSSVGGSDNWLASQVEAYSARVLAGLSDQVQSVDTSAQDRQLEDDYMLRAIGENPVIGTGAGFAYKPASGPVNQFAAAGGQYYGHNYYLWMLMKAGWLGLGGLILLLSAAILAAIHGRKEHFYRLAFAAALLGQMAVMIVAPLPNGSPTALVLGALLALTGLGPLRDTKLISSTSEPTVIESSARRSRTHRAQTRTPHA